MKKQSFKEMTETKFYKKIFLTAGLADYGDDNEGLLLLSKKTIDEALNTLKNKDVVITHEGKEPVGKVVDVYFDNEKGAFVCGFNVWNSEAIDLLDNQDYSISCAYDILEKGEGGTYHHIRYDEEAKKIEFENIAIVKNPRYQEAREVLNSVNEERRTLTEAEEETKENGGKGSGNWGHKGRKGKVGGSGKGGNNKERIKHGRILGQIARQLKDNKKREEIKRNLATKIKDIKERIKGREKQIMADIKRRVESKRESKERQEFNEKYKELIEHEKILKFFEDYKDKIGFNPINIYTKLKEAKEGSEEQSIFSSNKSRKYNKDLFNKINDFINSNKFKELKKDFIDKFGERKLFYYLEGFNYLIAEENIEKVIKARERGENKKEEIGKITQEQLNFLKKQGLNVNEDTKHTIDTNFIGHRNNRHGETTEKQKDQIPITDDDIRKIPLIINNPDNMEIDLKRQGVKYKKQMKDGTIYFVEVNRTNNNELEAKTMYKKKKN